ncbi:unnamed protein product, partial [Brenthis ino]
MDSKMEILEFITGQLSMGSLPLDHELINNIQEFVASNEGERSDRAWLAVLARVRCAAPARAAPARAAVPRPRVLWRLDAMLDQYEDAIRQFFNIPNPSTRDIDEFFEYLGSKVETDTDARDRIRPFFPALVDLQPRSAAAMFSESWCDSVASILKLVRVNKRLDFCESLLESGRLRDEAATIYLKDLSVSRPKDVKSILVKNQGIIRPEDALRIVREVGVKDAEPACLEATGDQAGALEALLGLIASTDDEEDRTELINEASSLCLRVGPTVPAEVAAELWTRLLRSVAAVPPALLFEAIQYLPLEELVVRSCRSVAVAGAVVRGGAARRAAWRGAAAVARREAHEALARALVAARRALAVRGACGGCGRALAAPGVAGVRTAHCARAFHTDCAVEATCACGRRAPADALALAPAPPRRDPPPAPHDLLLLAPPRPDLEGVV